MAALTRIVKRSNLPLASFEFLSAFTDRQARPLRKNFSQLALDSLAWFQSEPDLLVHLRRMPVTR